MEMSLGEYINNNLFDQQDLADLLNFIVEKIEKEKKYPNNLTKDDIEIKEINQGDHRTFEYTIGFDPFFELETMEESQKINPICEIMLYCLSNGEKSKKKSSNTVMNDPTIIKEYKTLLETFYSANCFLNFKMFIVRIKNIYKLFGEENIFKPGGNFNNPAGPSGYNTERVQRKRLEMFECNYCKKVSLEPMLILNACGCKFHKLCFEATVVATIEAKELKSEFELKERCANHSEHLHHDDLEILVEIEKNRFTLSRPIILMIKYYYLYTHEGVNHYCNCNDRIEHYRVDRASKRPYMLCNGKCSFCGERWEEICEKFQKALNWAY